MFDQHIRRTLYLTVYQGVGESDCLNGYGGGGELVLFVAGLAPNVGAGACEQACPGEPLENQSIQICIFQQRRLLGFICAVEGIHFLLLSCPSLRHIFFGPQIFSQGLLTVCSASYSILVFLKSSYSRVPSLIGLLAKLKICVMLCGVSWVPVGVLLNEVSYPILRRLGRAKAIDFKAQPLEVTLCQMIG